MTSHRVRALSLLEAIIAVFILFSAFLVLISLFHSGLRYSSRGEQQQLAVMLAERKCEEVRIWAQTPGPGGYSFDDWTAYNNVTTTPTDFPGYRIKTEVSNNTVYSSCSSLEQAFPNTPGSRRQFSTSCKLLKVTVSWGQDSQLQVSGLVASPPRQFRAANPIVVTTSAFTSPLARDAVVNLTAQAFDSFGNPVTDLTFAWIVKSGKGYGTLVQSRDGSAASFTNAVNTTGFTFYPGGNVTIQARASLHGKVAVGDSAPILCAP